MLKHALTKYFSFLMKGISKYIKIPKTYIPFVQFPYQN